jgi:hypothetical protein
MYGPLDIAVGFLAANAQIWSTVAAFISQSENANSKVRVAIEESGLETGDHSGPDFGYESTSASID